MADGRDRVERADHVELAARIAALAPWFHNIDLGGIATAPDHFLGDYPRVKFAGFAEATRRAVGETAPRGGLR